MSLQYDSLHDALVALQAAQDDYRDTVQRFVTSTAERFAAAERREAELRDDLHAVANRVEALTRTKADDPFGALFEGMRDAD